MDYTVKELLNKITNAIEQLTILESSNKREAVPEVPVQEQPKYLSEKELRNMAIGITSKFYDKRVMALDAKLVLKYCAELIDLNSLVVMHNDELYVSK